MTLLLFVAGLALLVLGASLLVRGASGLALALGISPLAVGLTVVAFGTSAPELAVSVGAALGGRTDIATGNVVGSNIFNVFCVLGVSSMISPRGVAVAPAALSFDIPVMTAVAFACLPVFMTGGSITRWEGALFVAYYVAYTTYLILASQQHDHLDEYSAAMLYVALPLTALTLGLMVVLDIRRRRRSG